MGANGFLDILRTFDGILPLDDFLLFSTSISSEFSHGLKWVNPKDGICFVFSLIFNMLS